MAATQVTPEVKALIEECMNRPGTGDAFIRQSKETLRHRCKVDPWFFIYYVLGYRDIDTELHHDMLDRWMKRRHRLYLLFQVPRGHLKTSLWTIGMTMWELLIDFNLRILIINAVYSNAQDMMAEIKAHYETNEVFRWLFPEYCLDLAKDGRKKKLCRFTAERIDLPCGNRMGRREGNIECLGVEMSLVSKHYDLFMYDDLVNDVNTATSTYRTKVWKWFLNSWQLRHSPTQSRIRDIGTPWHIDDTHARIIKNEKRRRKEGKPAKWLIYRRAATEKTRHSDKKEPIWPERFTLPVLEDLKADLGSYIYACNPGESPILMSDYSIRRFDEIREGDQVIGFEFGDGIRKRLVYSRVQEVRSRKAAIVRIQFDDGSEITCTADHHWFTERFQENRKPYMPAVVGRSIVRVFDLPGKWDPVQAAYLAGIFDGEGNISEHALRITQSYSHNPAVCDRIQETLEDLGLTFDVQETRPNEFDWVLESNRSAKIELMHNCNIGKRDQVVKSLNKYSSRIGKSIKVISIEPVGETEVYSMQTTTGNYVVWGLASKNCQYDCNPISPENALFQEGQLHAIEEDDLPDNLLHFAAVDLSEEGDDYTVVVVASFDDHGKMYVRQIIRGQISPLDLIDALRSLQEIWGLQRVAIETIGFQKTIAKFYRDYAEEREFYIPWREMKRGNKDKIRRYLGLQPLVERDYFHYVDKIANSAEMVEEMTTVSVDHLPTHDDILDCLSDLQQIFYAAPGETQEEGPPPGSIDAVFGTLEDPDEMLELEEAAAFIVSGHWNENS